VVKVIISPPGGTKPTSSAEERIESARVLTGIIPDDFDLDEMRAERIGRA
jgi:hypothetical protein